MKPAPPSYVVVDTNFFSLLRAVTPRLWGEIIEVPEILVNNVEIEKYRLRYEILSYQREDILSTLKHEELTREDAAMLIESLKDVFTNMNTLKRDLGILLQSMNRD